MRSEPTDLIQSVSRALRVLEQVTRADHPMPVKAVARRCGLNLSTTYHLMRTLCYEGYLTRQPDGSYGAGPQVAVRFHDLAGHFQRPPSATAVLRHLAAECGHTAYLAKVSAGAGWSSSTSSRALARHGSRISRSGSRWQHTPPH